MKYFHRLVLFLLLGAGCLQAQQRPSYTFTSVNTDVPVFIGFTEKVPKGAQQGVWVHSSKEYEDLLGGGKAGYFLSESVEMYFLHGGKACYVISAGPFSSTPTWGSLEKALLQSRKLAVQLVLIPDAAVLPIRQGYALQRQSLALCEEMGDRFALIDLLPASALSEDVALFRKEMGVDGLSWGAAYYPWLTGNGQVPLPPSGALAGIYARNDQDRGVWKAPAGLAVNASGLSLHLSQADTYLLYSPSTEVAVNAIRELPGQGLKVWGGRTLAGNDPEWRYVSMKRFSIMLEQSIRRGTQRAVFEPNDAPLWQALKKGLESYLESLWRKGAFQGQKPSDAFFVKCGLGETMTQADLNAGRLIITVGFAPTRPAEFVVLQIPLNMRS